MIAKFKNARKEQDEKIAVMTIEEKKEYFEKSKKNLTEKFSDNPLLEKWINDLKAKLEL